MIFLIFKDASYSPRIIPHTSVPLLLIHCFGCQTMEYWWKKMQQECDSYRFILWSFIMIMSVITSTLLFTSQMSALSLIFSFLLKISNNLTFLPSFLVKILPLPHATNWILLKTFSYLFFFNLTFPHIFVQALWRIVHWAVSSLKMVIIIYSPLVSLMPANFL